MKSLLEKLENYWVAITFAEAGIYEVSGETRQDVLGSETVVRATETA